MFITYRRTGGVFALLAVIAIALAATVLAVAVFFARVVLPASWRRRAVPSPTPWPQQTIEATVVNPAARKKS